MTLCLLSVILCRCFIDWHKLVIIPHSPLQPSVFMPVLDKIPMRAPPRQGHVLLHKSLGLFFKAIRAYSFRSVTERPKRLVCHPTELTLKTIGVARSHRVRVFAESLRAGAAPCNFVHHQGPGKALSEWHWRTV